MLSTLSLFANIKTDYPQFTFHEADRFAWSSDTKTLHLDLGSQDAPSYLLHELGHALLSHNNYHKDIHLIQIERDAWEFARARLAPQYGITISEELIQENLDTYREWLHSRSKCPACTMTGLQANQGHYICLACGHRWISNEARSCALRRYDAS